MPALSYKKQFVLKVADGSKPHSIRAWRKRPFRVGDTLMHYFGMRTKQCRKIRADTICTKARPIEIRVNAEGWVVVILAGKTLPMQTVQTLARRDGFRDASEFAQFFRDTHGPDFSGQLVEWNPSGPQPLTLSSQL